MSAKPGPNAERRIELMELTAVGELWGPLEDGAVRCWACGHRCRIPLAFDGICKVRSNPAGKLLVPWGYVAGLQLDPIEKKPFFHALPGSSALSFGMLGCDYRCGYCQNWKTSQVLRDTSADGRAVPVRPEELTAMALEQGARVLTSTYNEPLITSEWAVAIFRKARASGLVTSYVSNGNGTPEVIAYLRRHLDLYKIDLKGFRDKAYRSLGGVLQHVLDTIQAVHRSGLWLEVVTLLVPGFNDDPAEIRDLTRFLKAISPDIPWHVNAFHPDYKMTDRDRTTVESVVRSAEIAREEGLRYVYAGNLPGRVGDWESTRCPSCAEIVVERRGFAVVKDRLKQGACPKCGTAIAGFWQAPTR